MNKSNNKLAIKDNNLCKESPCAICGLPYEPDYGNTLFLENSWDAVCDDCGIKYAPELHKLLVRPEIDLRDNFSVELGW